MNDIMRRRFSFIVHVAAVTIGMKNILFQFNAVRYVSPIGWINIHTNKMKLWTIYQGEIFLLHGWRGVACVCTFLCWSLLTFILSPVDWWVDDDDGKTRVCDRIFCILQTNLVYCPSAPICSLFKWEKWKSQCDLPTHNLNCIHWSEKTGRFRYSNTYLGENEYSLG